MGALVKNHLPHPWELRDVLEGLEPDERVPLIKSLYLHLEHLYDCLGRSRALTALELHERGKTFDVIGKLMGVNRSRAAQLAHDGKLWRQDEATPED